MNPYLGEVKYLPWNWAPRGWAVCNGAVLSIAQNTALFSLLGTTYGGNGVTTFALPDLQGRVPMHRSNNGQYPMGLKSGVETVTITINTMPSHFHGLLATTIAGDKSSPLNLALAQSSVDTDFYYGPDTSTTVMNPSSVSMVGGNQPHENMEPYQVVGYCIAVQGVFPSRN